ncbi:MAG: phosphoenolpyruvate--protein phosphotransferase [Betaproteobacteria bacterium]
MFEREGEEASITLHLNSILLRLRRVTRDRHWRRKRPGNLESAPALTPGSNASAVRSSELTSQLPKTSPVLDELRQITQELNQATSLEGALAIVVHRVKESLAVDVCSVYLVEASGERCILMATDGLDPRAVGRIQFGQREGLVGLVLESGQSLSMTNAQQHPRFRYSPEFGEEAYHAFLGVPIVHHGRPLGVLSVRQTNDRTFTGAEEAFLLTIAGELAGRSHAAAVGATDVSRKDAKQTDSFLTGIKAAPGAGIGVAVLPSPAAELESVPDRSIDDPEAEEAVFRQAVAAVQLELRASGERMAARMPTEAHAMFQVYAALLDDEEMFADTINRIRAGNWAPGALRATIADHAEAFEKMDDPYLRARAEDIRGLGRRVLLRVQSRDTAPQQYPKHCVLVGEEISVARIADVPIEQLAGIVCTRGSPFSHAAILARTLRIPAVIDIGNVSLAQLEGHALLVDGYQGRVFIEPSPAVRDEFQRLIDCEADLAKELETLRDLPAETPDGARVSLQANAGLLSDLVPALDTGAEGIGLYRTEFTFMVRDAFPDEGNQTQVYGDVLAAFAPRPVTMRTLDVGGDKALPYFPVAEDNSLLGWRGIRLTLDNPGIFLTQLRAMLRANATHGNLQLLLPMISTCQEVDDTRELMERACSELLQGGQAARLPPLGVMLEVPSALYQIADLAKRVDFFSIGTNDLTQYLLAVDRNNARVASRFDSLHPAMLRAIDHAVRQAREYGKPLSVCGEMAGEPASAILLMGMGVDTLSMASPSLPRVKQALRTFTQRRAQELLAEALRADNPADVHRMLDDAFEQVGLSSLLPSPGSRG